MFNTLLSKFEKPLNMVISIDEEAQSIHFYTMDEENKTDIKHDEETYKAALFTDEFYEKFEEILTSYHEKNPTEQPPKVAVVIPDKVILFDAINVPVIKKQAMTNSLTASLNSLYKNSNDLKFNNVLLGQNKQYATYCAVGIRKIILSKIKEACENSQYSLSAVTFNSNSVVNGASTFNPDLRTESSLVLDVKGNLTKIAYVVKGKVCGYYSLPFGYATLYKSRLAAEDLLFEHASAELLVLNAKERAKSRHLTTLEKSFVLDDNEDDEVDNEEGLVETFTFDKKLGTKKVARKLPKSMLRESPKTREEFVFENFRLFMKWAQDVLIFNPILTDIGETKTIYINMPREFDYLFEMANKEVENIEYKPLIPSDVYDEEVANNLELYGGFYCKQFNKTNTF